MDVLLLPAWFSWRMLSRANLLVVPTYSALGYIMGWSQSAQAGCIVQETKMEGALQDHTDCLQSHAAVSPKKTCNCTLMIWISGRQPQCCVPDSCLHRACSLRPQCCRYLRAESWWTGTGHDPKAQLFLLELVHHGLWSFHLWIRWGSS